MALRTEGMKIGKWDYRKTISYENSGARARTNTHPQIQTIECWVHHCFSASECRIPSGHAGVTVDCH